MKCEFHKYILNGDYFVFFNRVLDRFKILLWDRDGLILIYRRLEQSRFERPPHDNRNVTATEIDATTLTLILSGVDLYTAKRWWAGARESICLRGGNCERGFALLARAWPTLPVEVARLRGGLAVRYPRA